MAVDVAVLEVVTRILPLPLAVRFKSMFKSEPATEKVGPDPAIEPLTTP